MFSFFTDVAKAFKVHCFFSDSVHCNRLTGVVGILYFVESSLALVRPPDNLSLGCQGREQLNPEALFCFPSLLLSQFTALQKKMDQTWPVWAVAREQNWPLSSQELRRRDSSAEQRLLAGPALLGAVWSFCTGGRELEQVRQGAVCSRVPGLVAWSAPPPPPPKLPFHKPTHRGLSR